MIRRGRRDKWLQNPIEQLEPWARLRNTVFSGVKIDKIPGFEHHGSTVIAMRHFAEQHEAPLITVPREMILSAESVHTSAKRCKPLGELVEALGDFARTPRGAILLYLLYTATMFCPDVSGDPSMTLAEPTRDEYIKYLPPELLPTFWNTEELSLLEGTTLKPAVEAKLKNLRNEFELLRARTRDVPWASRIWWDEHNGLIDFDDWLQVDAMYRSRALEYPKIGDCMVPCIDMANHASGEHTIALYDVDSNGDAVLLLREHKSLQEGEEITITYGDEKGVCEMIFSYGFIEEKMESAGQLFLDINIPDDDPLKPAKLHISTAAPGVKILEDNRNGLWESDFVWLVCVNEEDGLDFRVLQTRDGGKELKAFWQGQELSDPSMLREILEKDEKWEVFKLRAVATIQNRVEEQLRTLGDTMERVELADHGGSALVRDGPYNMAIQLRDCEASLLNIVYDVLETEKLLLAETDVVQRFLAFSMQ